MPEYLLFFNQQWVGDHPAEWYQDKGPRSMAVVDEMREAGVYVFAGGLEEEPEQAYAADPTSGETVVTDGPYVETKEFLGGFAVVRVDDDEQAKHWGAKIAEACGWPHEIRRFKPSRRVGGNHCRLGGTVRRQRTWAPGAGSSSASGRWTGVELRTCPATDSTTPARIQPPRTSHSCRCEASGK
jgi:hypothetical protein